MGSNRYKLCSNVFRLQLRVAVFQKHFDHLAEISVKLVERFALRVSTGKPWNKSNQQTSLRTFFDDSGK